MYAIDCHAHVFPDELAEKVVPKLAADADMPAPHKGTVSDLLSTMEAAGVARSVLVSIATRPGQARSINDWLHKQRSEKLIPFAAIHPDDPGMAEEIRRVRELGFKGVKLHPNYQEFLPDEDRVIRLVREIRDAGMILLIHGGADRAFEDVPGSPRRLAALHDAVPGLTMIVAHFGGFECWDEAEELLAGRDVYFDVSFTMSWIEPEAFKRLAKKRGADRILFGTDYPWESASEQIDILKKMNFSKEELEAILHGNAERLLGLRPLLENAQREGDD